MEIGYECKATLEDGSEVALQFKDFADIPGRVSLDNQGNSEAQLWQSLQWGLISPAHWPEDAEQAPGWHVFRDMPMRRILKVHNDWQAAGGVTAGESSASTTSPENTETS